MDLRQQILLDRRSELSNLLGGDPSSRIQFSEEFTGSGAEFFKACADNNLEGIVSKLTIAPYRSGRTKTWLKTKCFTESNFIVIGTDRDRKTGALRALLAHPESDGLLYAGAAFIAIGGKERDKFFRGGPAHDILGSVQVNKAIGRKMVPTPDGSAGETFGGQQESCVMQR